jgi:hypothetical protein
VKKDNKLQSLGEVDVRFRPAPAGGNVGDVRFPFDFIGRESELAP